MNTYKTKNGVTIHKWTKPHYNLLRMYEQMVDRYGEMPVKHEHHDKAYTILHKWYHGLSGEVSTVHKLQKLGMIGEDKFIEATIKPYLLKAAIHKTNKTSWKEIYGNNN